MRLRLFAIFGIAVLLAGCGGGGSGGGEGSGGGAGSPSGSGDKVSLTATASTAPVPSLANTDLDFLVSNPGTSVANDVALAVTLGSGLTKAGVLCSAAGGAVCPADPQTMSVPTLPAGGSLRFSVSVIPSAGASGAISSTGTVSATNDQVTSNNSAQVSITAYSADVSVIGSTSASDFFSGSNVPYAFTVTNSGPDAALNVGLDSSLSSGQTLIDMTCVASGGATCPAQTGATMTIPSLPSGGSLNFSITSRLSMDVLVSVSDTLRATSLGDRNAANNTTSISAITRIPTSPSSPSFVSLQSDTGDYVGDGHNYSYTRANAVFEVYANGGTLNVKATGDQRWDAIFYMPASMAQIQAGTYTDQIGAPFHDPSTGGFYWNGEGRACGPHTDWFKVDGVVYAAGQIVSIDLRFEQHCNGVTPALRGQVHWVAGDESRPPGPVNPPPVGLWQPAAGVTPASGNYVYLESDAGDFIGRGRRETYTQANAILTVDASSGAVNVNVLGNRNFGGSFEPMVPLTRMEPGYYPNAQNVPNGNPAVGRFNFTGDGHGCNVLTGWFIVDNIVFSGSAMTALDLRFEQHCEGDAPALRGNVHWRSDDPTQPAGPQVPPPAGLWAPPAGAVPATGNVIYLQSDAGDFIGGGLAKTYTPLDSVIEIGAGGMTPVGNRFQLTVRGDQEWTGYFQAMNTLPDLRAGYYGNLLGFPANNPVIGGLAWSGQGRGCNQASGWFVIDRVTYSGSTLDSIELRFEQHCENQAPALRGLIRWSASDTRQLSPPELPIPTDLWSAPAGAAPATGNYVYLQSDTGDFIGKGETHLYTQLDTVFLMSTSGSTFYAEVQGDQRWGAYFIPMMSLSQLQVGYYAGVTRGNLARGSSSWGGEGRGCNASNGWFAVDAVTFTAGSLTSIDLRFEQHCEGATPALRGKIHWRFDDPTQPPGPQNPPPAGLWAPPAGATPASGNFFYVQSDPGEFIGQGRTQLFTPANASFQGATLAHEFIVGVQNSSVLWSANFDHMSSISQFQPGYYPNVSQLLLHNPTRGGMDISGESRSCTGVTGWFVIDSVTYTGTSVSAIDLRFEQHCGNASTPALHGRIRWSQ
ncbi:MAG: hypothetical protein WDO56_27265 [Gammaproteobacteria bacterium]